MNRLFFWNDWKKPYKFLYLFLLILFLASLLLYLYGYFTGTRFLIDWDIISQFDSVKVPADQFTQHLFSYSIDTGNYIAKERFFATPVKIIPEYGPWFLLFVFTGIVVILTLLTRLELPWFAIGMGVFIFIILLMVSLNPNISKVFGESAKKFVFASTFLYAATGFYFQAFDKRLSFFQRLLVFAAITIGLAALVAMRSETPMPFYAAANLTILLPVIIAIIFIISISFEIITAFLFITSGKNSKRTSIFHFALISVLYLVNLLLIFLKKRGIIPANFISIDVFVIYIASAILGIWGIKKRASLFSNIITLSHSSFLYISMAIVSTATIAYAFVTGNDPMVRAFEYIILYSHLGIGTVFFLYILYNFWELFERNIPAYDLVYAPRRMPFFMVRPIGLIIMLSLFMQSGMYAYKMAKSGYHNLVGDVFLKSGDLGEARAQYDEGNIYAHGNLKSGLALASVNMKLNKPKEATEALMMMVEKNPSEYAFANLANLYMQEDNFFYAVFKLHEGLKMFPRSGYLQNNMAMIYSTKGMWDSTLHYLTSARNILNDEVTNTNFSWLLLNRKLWEEADSIASQKDFGQSVSYQVNKLAAFNTAHKKYTGHPERFLKDSLLNIRSYAYFFNYVVNQLKSTDTTVLKNLNEYTRYSGNDHFYHELIFLKSMKLYYSGHRKKAYEILGNLIPTVGPSSAPYYLKILGLWAMQMSSYENAAELFDEAAGMNLLDAESQLYKAIALLEAGYINDGTELLRSLGKTPDMQVRILTGQLLSLYTALNLNEAPSLDDTTKYRILHFRKDIGPENMTKILQSMSDTYKPAGAAEMMDLYLTRGDTARAMAIHREYEDLAAKAGNTYGKGYFNYQYLRLLEQRRDWKTLAQEIRGIYLPEDKRYMLPYYRAISGREVGKAGEAEKEFREAIRQGPLNDKAYTGLAAVYNEANDATKAYDVLLEGTRLNPRSVEILKMYALQTLKLNLTSYGDETLNSLKEMLPPGEFEQFRKKYGQERAQTEAQFQQF